MLRLITKIANKIDNQIDWSIPRPMIQEVAKNRDYLVGVEIGTQFGINALNILRSLNIRQLYLIDPYIYYEGIDGGVQDINVPHSNIMKQAHSLLKRYDNITWLQMMSAEAADSVGRDLDFVYIDGNHLYKYVKQDLEIYWSILRSGGIIGGHDINLSGVFHAVADFSKEIGQDPVIKRKDWWFKK